MEWGRPGFDPWVGKIPWRRKWQPTPVPLPGESHGGRSLVGYSPWCHKESDTTERLHFHFQTYRIVLLFILLWGTKNYISKFVHIHIHSASSFILVIFHCLTLIDCTSVFLYSFLQLKWKWSRSVVSDSLWLCSL